MDHAHSHSLNDRTTWRVFHGLAAAFVVACFASASLRPGVYAAAMQEDRAIEWMTTLSFAVAGLVRLANAFRERRVFDGLVAVFCLFAAGEEISWGQRLVGLTPPAYFLEHNIQQELNLHNFANTLGGPKWPFVFVLLAYGLLLPAAARLRSIRPMLDRMGASVPVRDACVWLLVSAVLLIWYPLRYTGEWCELLAGATFLASCRVRTRTLAIVAPAIGVAGLALTVFSARGDRSPARVACAAAEARELVAALRPALEGRSMHVRVWSLTERRLLPRDSLGVIFSRAQCGVYDATRAQYAIDPWGTAYWVRVRSREKPGELQVYSFGPNRRRDGDGTSARHGDDIVAR